MERAQNLTAFSAVNGFYSYVALCAGSNKAVEVFDLNVGKSVRVILDAQTRPIHAICQNEVGTSLCFLFMNTQDYLVNFDL